MPRGFQSSAALTISVFIFLGLYCVLYNIDTFLMILSCSMQQFNDVHLILLSLSLLLQVTATVCERMCDRMSPTTFNKQWHRVLTVGLLSLFLASSHGLARHLQHQSPQSKSHPICIRQRISVSVDYEGCESTNTTIPICTGQCRSYTYVDLLPPFQFKKCNCCQAPDFTSKPKVRRLKFRCNGVLEEKKVYFTYVRKCGCVSCTG